MTYKDIDTTLIIAEKEFPCVFSFDYQPEEKPWFNPVEGIGDPGCDEQITITEAKIYNGDKTIDLFTPEYDFLLTEDTFEVLEDSAREALELEQERIESDKIDRMVA